MKEKLEILKKWVATGQVKTARGRQHDDLLTLIGQMEVALRQSPSDEALNLISNKIIQEYSPF